MIETSGPPPSAWSPAEILAWRSNMEDRLQSLRDLIITRIEAMDKAAVILSDNVNRVPTLLDRETGRLVALFEERTNNIRHMISARDDQAKQDKATAAIAVDTALTSLKELIFLRDGATSAAITKSESATANDLESLSKIIGSTKDGIANDIMNLKQRMDRSEGSYTGQRELRKDDHMTVGSIVGVVGGIVGLLALIIAGLGLYPHMTPFNPVGADTKRVDDLIAQSVDRNRDVTARLDAMSARMNSLQQSLTKTPP